MPFYDSTWAARAEKVSAALSGLIDEHDAPNRFHIRDVMDRSGLTYDTIGRVGRYGGEFVVRSRVVRYERGWFNVGDVFVVEPHPMRAQA